MRLVVHHHERAKLPSKARGAACNAIEALPIDFVLSQGTMHVALALIFVIVTPALSAVVTVSDEKLQLNVTMHTTHAPLYNNVEFFDATSLGVGAAYLVGNRRVLHLPHGGESVRPISKDTVVASSRSSQENGYSRSIWSWNFLTNEFKATDLDLPAEYGISHDLHVDTKTGRIMLLAEKLVFTKDGDRTSAPALVLVDLHGTVHWIWDSTQDSPSFTAKHMPPLQETSGPTYQKMIAEYVAARSSFPTSREDWEQRFGTNGTEIFHPNSVYWDISRQTVYLHFVKIGLFIGVSTSTKEVVRELDCRANVRHLTSSDPFVHRAHKITNVCVHGTHSWLVTQSQRFALYSNSDRCAYHFTLDWRLQQLTVHSETCLTCAGDIKPSPEGSAQFIAPFGTFVLTDPKLQCLQELFEGTAAVAFQVSTTMYSWRTHRAHTTQAGGYLMRRTERLYTTVVGWVACGERWQRLGLAQGNVHVSSCALLEFYLWTPFHVTQETLAKFRCSSLPMFEIRLRPYWEAQRWSIPTDRFTSTGLTEMDCAIEHELASDVVRFKVVLHNGHPTSAPRSMHRSQPHRTPIRSIGARDGLYDAHVQ